MTESNYSQFCDLYCDDKLIGSQMVHLVFRPDGTIVNREEIVFKPGAKYKGEFRLRVLGQRLQTCFAIDVVRYGDTVKVAPGCLTMNIIPQEVLS
jgi:hypothetical protein